MIPGAGSFLIRSWDGDIDLGNDWDGVFLRIADTRFGEERNGSGTGVRRELGRLGLLALYFNHVPIQRPAKWLDSIL